LEQQAFDAAQSGSIPEPPSPESIQAEQLQEDQQLRSALGDSAFAAFNQYRATIPDRIIVDALNQQGERQHADNEQSGDQQAGEQWHRSEQFEADIISNFDVVDKVLIERADSRVHCFLIFIILNFAHDLLPISLQPPNSCLG